MRQAEGQPCRCPAACRRACRTGCSGWWRCWGRGRRNGGCRRSDNSRSDLCVPLSSARLSAVNLEPIEPETIPETARSGFGDLVMMLMTPPSAEPQAAEAAPLMISIRSICCTGINPGIASSGQNRSGGCRQSAPGRWCLSAPWILKKVKVLGGAQVVKLDAGHGLQHFGQGVGVEADDVVGGDDGDCFRRSWRSGGECGRWRRAFLPACSMKPRVSSDRRRQKQVMRRRAGMPAAQRAVFGESYDAIRAPAYVGEV